MQIKNGIVSGILRVLGKLKAKNIEADTITGNLISKGGVTTSGTGAAYTATVEGITSLTAGVSFIMIPHVASTTTAPTLNVNGLGAKGIRRRLSNIMTSIQNGYSANWLAKGNPVTVIYDGTYWIVEGNIKTAVADLYGVLPISQGGTGSNSRMRAFHNLFYHPEDNFIMEISDDTVANWTNKGTGMTYYEYSDCLHNQPSTYGILISFVSGVDVFQLWKAMPTGNLFYRSGNQDGWSDSNRWRVISTTLN